MRGVQKCVENFALLIHTHTEKGTSHLKQTTKTAQGINNTILFHSTQEGQYLFTLKIRLIFGFMLKNKKKAFFSLIYLLAQSSM